MTQCVSNRCGIQPNLGKTVCYSPSGGACPADVVDLGASVWKSNLPDEERGVRILGCPFGSDNFVQDFLRTRNADEICFLDKITRMKNVQHAWLLMYFCLNPKINHLLRQLPPSLSEAAARLHDGNLQRGLKTLLGWSEDEELPAHVVEQSKFSIASGGFGLRDSVNLRHAAYWASWADTFPTLCHRFPEYTNLFSNDDSMQNCRCLRELADASHRLHQFQILPTWTELLAGAQPLGESRMMAASL